jgi:hypothetical protein
MSLSTLQMEFFVELFHPRVQSVETMGITMDTTALSIFLVITHLLHNNKSFK